MGRVRYTGPIRTVGDCHNARLLVWVFCLSCGHAMRENPWIFISRFGVVPLEHAAKHARCRRCGKRDAALFPSRVEFGPR